MVGRRVGLLAQARLALTAVSALATGLAPAPSSALELHVARSFDGSTSLHGAFAPNPRPDPAGAVGPAHVVELLSAYYAVYEKATSALLEDGSHVDFWTRAGAPEPIDFAFAPRLVYDAASGRWFAAAITFELAGADSWLALAVSKSADPTEGWTGFQVDVDLAAANWLDYVALGIDADALYLLTIRQQPTTETPLGLAVVVVAKADLLAETPTTDRARRLLSGFLLPGVGGQLAVNLDGGGPPMPVRANRADELSGFEVLGPVTAPTLSRPLAALTVEPLPRPPDAAQPGPKQDLATLAGLQFGAPVLRQDGSLWAVQGVEVDGRAAIRWLELDPLASAVVQSGVIADPELDFYVPSIAVSDARTVVIGFTGSSESVYPSAYAVAGAPVAGELIFGEPILVRAGVAEYEVLDRFDRNSWGDFSTTLVDPSNPASFWTFLPFAVARDVWEISIAELAVPEPDRVLLALAGAVVLGALRRRRG